MERMPESIERLYRELDKAREERDAAVAELRSTADSVAKMYAANRRARALLWVADVEDALAARQA